MQAIKQTVEKILTNEDRSAHPMTRATGCPVAHMKNSLTAGPYGPVALQDVTLLEKVSHFAREKIPARNVHALGTGAHGTLTITNDITKYSRASVFTVGKKTDLVARFSGIFTEVGDADTQRDPRGFALKFYTDEGNWDLLAINTPVFNLRDMKIGPDGVHAFKRNPKTSEWSSAQVWDFVVNHPESLHQTLMIFTNRDGTPISFRHMHAYGCNTFSLVNAKNERFWVKFHLISELGAHGLTRAEAKLLAGEDPNWLSRDLREAIDRKDFPRWRFACQIMPEEEGYRYPWTFDCTKVWKHADYPLIDIGIIEINRNPINFHSEIEQVAFSPATVPPGIGFSPDKLLQGRLLVYDDTQYHRLGSNFKQIPINRPRVEPNTNYVGGFHNDEVKNKYPHYYPSNYGGPKPNESYREPPFKCDGAVDYYDLPNEGTDEDYYGQARELFWKVLGQEEKQHLCDNIATSLMKVPADLAKQVCGHLSKIDEAFGQIVEKLCEEIKAGNVKMTEAEMLWKNLRTQLINNEFEGLKKS